MPAIQSTYPNNIAVAVPGQHGTMIPATVISRTIENAQGAAFGIAVSRGAGDNGAKPFTVGDTAILGITMIDRSVTSGAFANQYAQYEAAAIMTKGHIWVIASVAVVQGDPVFVIPATGAFAKTNASSAVQIPNAVWDSSAGIGGLALVRLQ